ncbi:hypothetical protein [Pseudolactococcus insecticola]|uniref:Uncharacterized protein n=1 Tax=Pseudolactococcus insecticola TaxID=2709158 RepID=A0A6A0B6G4_9LACT|nr:hypothetical protein [Lactococcus insecticola]GFH40842.1 hypothetical protein Hs20B_12400 [Lactococcus insecticola]
MSLFNPNNLHLNRPDVIRQNQRILETINPNINYEVLLKQIEKEKNPKIIELKEIIKTQILSKIAEKEIDGVFRKLQKENLGLYEIFSNVGTNDEKLKHEVDIYLLGNFGLIEISVKIRNTITGIDISNNLYTQIFAWKSYRKQMILKKESTELGKSTIRHFDVIPKWIEQETNYTFSTDYYKQYLVISSKNNIKLTSDKLNLKYKSKFLLLNKNNLDLIIDAVKFSPPLLSDEEVKIISNALHNHIDFKEENIIVSNMMLISEKIFSDTQLCSMIKKGV